VAAVNRPVPQTVPREDRGTVRAAAPSKTHGDAAETGTGASDKAAYPGGEARLLLVEDSTDDAELTLHALARCGIVGDAKWVRDGAEAMEWLAAGGMRSLRVMLLDLKMPRMDGYDVLRALKVIPAASGIVVIVMVSSHDTPEIERCLALGASAYLVKPPTVETLGEVMRKLDVPIDCG